MGTVCRMTESTPPSQGSPLRDRIHELLAKDGYRPTIDEDGDVAVTVQGQQLFARCVEAGPESMVTGVEVSLLRVFGQWQLEGVTADELTLLRACNSVTAQLAAIKVTLGDGTLMIAAEHLLVDPGRLQIVLTASLELVLSTVAVWNGTLARLTGVDPGDGSDGDGSDGGS
jgi:hypothetical protein